MSVKINTSRSRFDEWKRFTGVYQRMGQVAVDADWNEEVRLRTVDARRRTADVADGSPDDGFRIVGDFVLDPIRSTDGWTATDLPDSDERKPVPELVLDRHDPESLPWVIRSRWHPALRRTLPAPIDLTAVPRANSTPFNAVAVIFELRLERPPADDEIIDLRVLLGDADGAEITVVASTRGLQTSGWCEIVVTPADLPGIDLTRVTTWGVTGLPPVARTWLGALRAAAGDLGNDVVIRGGDGTLPGAGRMLVAGTRAFIERDLRYSAQPDFPAPPVLPDLPADGSRHHLFYLDVWEETVTALEDSTLLEPALDGVDTAARLRTVAQVRALPSLAAGEAETLPTPTGGGTLTTNVLEGTLPDRQAPEPFDPCRDRCLFTDNASTGDGYIGSDNLHVRVQVLRAGGQDIALWSRSNGSTVMALTHATADDSTTLRVSPADAARLRTGDIIVIEDRATGLRWDAPDEPVLRRLRGVHADTGLLELDEAGTNLTEDPVPLPVGGPVGRVFSPDAGATVRRWDGADLLLTGLRYRLSDGITFAFAEGGLGGARRSGDYWTFTARVHAPDGEATGVVDTLTASPPHGPTHSYTPLARATGVPRVLTDLRKRYLPLSEVRDRLLELGSKKFGPGVFVVVVGDGVRTFGDVDQSVADGLTGDEALQAALGLLGAAGGSIFIRSGLYQLEHPVLIRSVSSVRILGDGDATVLSVRGSGGAFYVDRGGADGQVSIEDLRLVEDPAAEVDIGAPGNDVDLPATRVLTLFDKLIAARFSPVALPPERVLGLDDIHLEGGVPDFLGAVGARVRVLLPGEGRAAGSVVTTIIELRRLQRLHPGTTLEDLPEAQPLLGALSALPHGVVTIADSHQVSVRNCRIESRRPGPSAIGVMITGTCGDIQITGNRVSAAVGVAALPYAPYVAPSFLAAFPRASLVIDGLEVRGNELRAQGAAVTGVHVADGLLAGTIIDDNIIRGFAVGVLVDDQAEAGRDAATDRIVVSANRVVGSTLVGIEVTGDGVDVVGNEIQNAPGAAPFQAGVLLTGHSSRVLDCWIEIPEAPALGPLAVLAGVVVGEGLDDGTTPSRPVFDVEIAGNRIEGSGAETTAIGIIVGGSQPIYDVRVRDNVLRNLGDAAVRTWSTSAPVGRLVIESNRIERVALGDLVIAADNTPVLESLQPGITASLPQGAGNAPRSLLAALVDSSLPGVRAPLDAAIRWIERLCLRGAIVLGGVDGAVVRGNRIAEVGRAGAFAAPNIDGAEIRTAAVAVVAAAEAVIEDNVIESVRAPYTIINGEGGDLGGARPEMLDVLAALGLGPSVKTVDRVDVHLTTVDLREQLRLYAAGAPDTRAKIGRSLFGPLDALVGELASLGSAAAALADPLQREMNDLRTAKTTIDQSATATALRATLSQAASATAPDDMSADAWDTAAQLDLALTSDAATVDAVAARVLQRTDTHDLPADVAALVSAQLGALIGSQNILTQGLAAASALGQVAHLRDQQALQKNLPGAPSTVLVGTPKTIVSTFVTAAIKQVNTIGKGGLTNFERINELRPAKDTLVQQIQAVNPPLATQLAANFQDLDRSDGKSKPAVARLKATLLQVQQLAADTLPEVPATTAGLIESQAHAATIQLYAKSLDRQISGLAVESEESAQKSLASFHGLMSQLGDLVKDQPNLATLAEQSTAAVRLASADATRRSEQLNVARALLDRMRGQLVDILPPIFTIPSTPPAEPVERRLSALSALALELDTVDAANVATAMAAFSAHLDRALDILKADASDRQRAHTSEADAQNGLAAAPGPIRATAVHTLAQLVDDTAAQALIAADPAPELVAAATLAHAAALLVDPAEDTGTRVTRVKTYLAAATTKLSAAVVAQAGQLSDVAGLTALLHLALGRIARGVDVVTIDSRPPNFGFQPSPADGVFTAGVERHGRISDNQVTESLSGVVVLGSAGHVVSEPPDDGMALEVAGNRLSGCAAQGIIIRPDGASKILLSDNQVVGSSGMALPSADPWGHAVVVVSGAGDLMVRDNVLTDNGNTTLRTLLHELALDWRGPIVVRGNTVRHLGGGAGGAGLLMTTEPVAATLIAQLSQAPFLGTEPPPRPIASGRATPVSQGLFSLREIAPLSPLARAEDVIQLGGLRQVSATTPIVNRALTLSATAPMPQPAVAASLATRYIDRSRVYTAQPLIDFLIRPPILIIPPRLQRPTEYVQVEGNDIDAAGPALLLLSEGNSLITAHVASNELRSRGRAGAVYLRRTDSTLFAANRCECLATVNVVVLRPGKAPVSVSSNVIIGAEPVHQIVVPPVTKAPGGVSLSVGVGASTLQVPVDARKLLSSLDRRKAQAGDLFAELLSDMGPAGTPAPANAVAGPQKARKAAATTPADAKQTGTAAGFRGTKLSSELLNSAALAGISANMPEGASTLIGARTLYGHTPGDETDATTALKKLVDQVSLHNTDPETAKAQLGAVLSAASGDPIQGLKLLDQNVLGLNTTKPTVSESLDNVSLIHEVLGDALALQGSADAPLVPVPLPPPPPNPADHSLVIIGGTRVAAVGNATTAGVLIQEADAQVELNP